MTTRDSLKKAGPHAAYFAMVTVFLDAFGIAFISPVLPDLLEQITGASLGNAALYGGYLTFIYAFMQFMVSPILGHLSDSFGRRPVIVISLAALGIDYLIMGFANSLWLLFVGRLIAGIFGATHAAALAFIADISTGKQRTRNFGLLGASFGAGFVAGPLIGGLLTDYGVRVPFFAAFFLILLNFFYGLFLFPESLPKHKRRPFTLEGINPFKGLVECANFPSIKPLFLALFLFLIADHVYVSVWPFYTREAFAWDSGQVGLTLAIFGFFHALTQAFLVGLLLKKYDEATITMIGIISTSLIMGGLLFIYQGWIIYIFLPFTALGGLTMPGLQSLMTQRVPQTHQGQLQGSIGSLSSLTTILSPLIMTYTFRFFTQDHTAYYHPAGVFGLAALICLFAALPVRYFLKQIR
ncbi:TCR/Tet family MFS transporter [uncultured Cohaesibacter sp.]|uniref:TCR/Tet family MFS transporter n=1 Tax=uncultured Cohaesibacter sp. TaxID=1002546 RepID=UPI0029C921E7|nr:TCR/Tet family MFS transporter [uncultured Cohaesibacter sp.]